MANFYVSLVNGECLALSDETTANTHNGTSSTAGDKIELRYDQTLTRFQVYKALEFFERWLKNGGANSAGANLGSP